MASAAPGREVIIDGPDLVGGGFIYTVPGGQYFFCEMVKFQLFANGGIGVHMPVVEYVDATSGIIAGFEDTSSTQDGTTGTYTFALGLTRIEVGLAPGTFSTSPLPPIGLIEGTKINVRSSDGNGGFWGGDVISDVRIYGYYVARDDESSQALPPLSPLYTYGETL